VASPSTPARSTPTPPNSAPPELQESGADELAPTTGRRQQLAQIVEFDPHHLITVGREQRDGCVDDVGGASCREELAGGLAEVGIERPNLDRRESLCGSGLTCSAALHLGEHTAVCHR
jgi:hypothetical protein